MVDGIHRKGLRSAGNRAMLIGKARRVLLLRPGPPRVGWALGRRAASPWGVRATQKIVLSRGAKGVLKCKENLPLPWSERFCYPGA